MKIYYDKARNELVMDGENKPLYHTYGSDVLFTIDSSIHEYNETSGSRVRIQNFIVEPLMNPENTINKKLSIKEKIKYIIRIIKA